MVDWIPLRLTITAMRSEGWIHQKLNRKCVGGNQGKVKHQREKVRDTLTKEEETGERRRRSCMESDRHLVAANANLKHKQRES